MKTARECPSPQRRLNASAAGTVGRRLDEGRDRHHVVDFERMHEAQHQRGPEGEDPGHPSLPGGMSSIRLTSLLTPRGVAAAADLAEVLKHLPAIDDANVLVDAATRDDAAVYRLSADRALVATVDFFTPIVDDPASWGAIAAANALSDVYAWAATAVRAETWSAGRAARCRSKSLGEVLRGAAQITREAGC
jgi:hypothetical protein